MTKFLLILIILLTALIKVSSQIKPIEKGFQEYSIKLKEDTIDFYIYNPDRIEKKHLFVHIDGSYPAPLWIESNPCCVTLDPFNYALIPKEYAYLVISKHGFSFSEKEDFEIPPNFWKKNTLDFRVKRVNEIIEFIVKEIFTPERIVLVGTSQGSDVAAKLATVNNKITHLGFWASGGLSSLMEFVMFVRKDAIAGNISEQQAVHRIDSLLYQFKEMFNNPTPHQFWDENSFLSYVSFSEPPVENLLKLNIPIYVAIGTKDENVAVENSYIIPIEFIRHRKTNLTFKHWANYDHGFIEKNVNGQEVDRFDTVTKDFIKWLTEN